MFWDKVSPVYDLFETIYNNKVYSNTGKIVAEEIDENDTVLECACGTGAISKYIAPKCKLLIAADLSKGMLKQTYKKCHKYDNVRFKQADMMHLRCSDERFDKVVAGNVIHLLDEPVLAIKELMRVCKPGGKLIIPTYINISNDKSPNMASRFFEKLGVDFKCQFDFYTYARFFFDAGYTNAVFRLAEGRMPCAIAIITK